MKTTLAIILMGLGMVSVSGGVAADPTPWTPAGGAIAGQYCYDFGNYIPATDSPVIGGWMPIGLNGISFWPYGKVCVSVPFGGNGDPYYLQWYYSNNAFYTDGRAPQGGIYFSVAYRVMGGIDDSWAQYRGKADLSCPRNSAKIHAPGYQRSDGVTEHAPISFYSLVGNDSQYAHPWAGYSTAYSLVGSNGGYVSQAAAQSHNVCVKTDTSQ